MWGERERILPAHQGERVHEVPHTQLPIFRNTGHFPHRDDPARFIRALDSFVARRALPGAQAAAAWA